MINLFGIEKGRKFSDQEKTLIDKFIFSILKKYKDSELTFTNTKIYPENDPSGVTEKISKYINLWEININLIFEKVHLKKKHIKDNRNMEVWGFKFIPGAEKPNSLHGMRIEVKADERMFNMGATGADNKPWISNEQIMSMALEYDSEDFLSEKTLINLEKNIFKNFKDSIIKPKRKQTK